mmetsp:Transcript_95419/g.164644  ORF Transcript_95419/g.164644 Transcript_95419/m.164644 type:complete len:82 (-) Transcript_95419:111-356(-)
MSGPPPMRYKGINLRDLADKIPATDAKDGFGRLQAQPDGQPTPTDAQPTSNRLATDLLWEPRWPLLMLVYPWGAMYQGTWV